MNDLTELKPNDKEIEDSKIESPPRGETHSEKSISENATILKDSEKNSNQAINLAYKSNESFDSKANSLLLSDGDKIKSAESRSDSLYNWQATKMTVKERFAFLFHNEILCDIYFIVGKKHTRQRIPAHKFILSCGSSVFDAMFNGPLSSSDIEIVLPDVEPSAFLAFLRYLYTDEVQIDPETVMATLYIAKKYAVPSLEKHCVQFLQKNLGSENAFTLLYQARLFDEHELANLCLETIDNNTAKSMASEGFLDIDIDTLCAVIERDSIKIGEAELFKAVVEWGKAECSRKNLSQTTENLRAVIEKALKLIRFPLMSLEEFASDAAQSGILTDKEALQLFLYFTVNPKPSISFSDLPRHFRFGKQITVSRFHSVHSKWGYIGNSDRVGFVVDRKIFITGFGLYGSSHSTAEYDVSMQLIQLHTGKVCAFNKTSFASDGTTSIFTIFFRKAVEILPHTVYTAEVTLKGPDSHFGSNGLQKIEVDIPGKGNGKVTFEFYSAGINNNGTSVEKGQIPEIIFHV